MAYKILHYAGIALLAVAIVFIYFFFKNFKKDEKLSFIENLKKNKLFGIVGAASLILSFILFEVSFFIPGDTNFMLNQKITDFNAGRLALSYIFVTLAAIGWIGIVYGYYFYKIYKNDSKELKKLLLLVWSISIPVVAISTILYLEGNAPYIQYPLVNNLHIGKQGIELTNNYVQTGHDFDGINIAFYAIGILGGAFVVLFICDHFMFKYYKHHGLLYTCFFIAVPCGIIGARLWYVCIDLMDYGMNSQFAIDPSNIFKIWEGGLAIMGGAVLGIIGGVTTMIVLTYVMKKPQYKYLKLLHVMDIIIPCILVAQAIGRWGNFFNNEVYGFEVNRQAFCFLPSWILNNMQISSHASGTIAADKIYLPLFLIESISNTIGYFFIYFGIGRGYFTKWIFSFINLFSKDKENPIIKEKAYHANGTLLGWYLFWYGSTRAVLEGLRTKADFYQSSLTTSYILMGVGLAIVVGFILFNEIYTKRIRLQRIAGTDNVIPVYDVNDELSDSNYDLLKNIDIKVEELVEAKVEETLKQDEVEEIKEDSEKND